MADDLHHELYAILAECWDLIERGARHTESPLHAPVLATVGAGGEPDARTVLIESTEAAQRRLYVNTDRRSRKFAELRENPRLMLVFYQGAVQIRLRATATLHHANALARRSWERLPEAQRIHYRTRAAPGSPIARGEALRPPPRPRDADEGVENYAVIEAFVTAIDWLRTEADGEHRAAFTWSEEGYIRGQWVAP